MLCVEAGARGVQQACRGLAYGAGAASSWRPGVAESVEALVTAVRRPAQVRRAFTPPRFGTSRRPKRATLGPVLAEVAGGLGFELFDWQRMVADVSLELVGRRGGGLRRLAARSVGVVVPRQCGKSKMAAARAWTQCLLPDLGTAGVIGGPLGAQSVGWLCQDRASAFDLCLRKPRRSCWN